MIPILATLAPGLIKAASRLLDRLTPDPAEREKAKLALLQAEGQQALQKMQTSLFVILAEANSADPWTSRVRPTFLYMIHCVILLCVAWVYPWHLVAETCFPGGGEFE
ncbi:MULTISPECIES: 3TM-type holin [Nitrosomonas]|uniref:Holin (3TMs family) n=1 Tax=Nitrosomonas communis TaxID=44574 RepID=A0A5D3YBN2_9PROT|nr:MULTISPECIES: 3TM-type holin [Nitrosomonas]TYP74438.1 holin (3TMs family) [Nitrosomonas communis]UVS62922.1 holin family protein [Nitrosomonas sp. PLL12]